jgi:hypothetical protein
MADLLADVHELVRDELNVADGEPVAGTEVEAVVADVVLGEGDRLAGRPAGLAEAGAAAARAARGVGGGPDRGHGVGDVGGHRVSRLRRRRRAGSAERPAMDAAAAWRTAPTGAQRRIFAAFQARSATLGYQCGMSSRAEYQNQPLAAVPLRRGAYHHEWDRCLTTGTRKAAPILPRGGRIGAVVSGRSGWARPLLSGSARGCRLRPARIVTAC